MPLNKIFLIVCLFNGLQIYPLINDDSQKISSGLYLIYLGNIDIKTQTFRAEFYLNFKWKGNRTAKNFELLNATDFNQYFFSEWDEGGFHYLSCKVRGTFRTKMDVSKFPFDRQVLNIEIGDYVWVEDSLKYIVNDTLTGLSHKIEILDWKVKKHNMVVKTDSEMGSKYSLLVFNVYVERKYAFFFIKILVPVLIVLLVALLNLFIPKNELESCISLGVTSLLSIIALHFSISGQLPDVSYPTSVDILMMGSYFIVFLSMVEVIFIYNMIRLNKTSLVTTVERYARWVIPSIYLIFLALLFQFYKIFY